MLKCSKLLLAGILLMTLTGCIHHLSEVECKVMDWHQVGVTDGAAGKPMSNLQQSIQDCQKYHLTVDTQAYQQGYLVGAAQFCKPTYDAGVAQGTAGGLSTDINSRQGFCSSNGKPFIVKDYLRGYQAGIINYCTYNNGKSAALQGQAANAACVAANLKPYMTGWNAGNQQLCSSTDTAFMYGKAGTAYPAACDPLTYPQFKRQYDRGSEIKQRLDQLNTQLNNINANINQLVQQNGLMVQNGVYSLGPTNNTPAAQQALATVQSLQPQINKLNNEIFKVNLMQ